MSNTRSSEQSKLPAKNIVIIGAGPMGLYLAAKLVDSGVNSENITIVDPRINTYTRPGNITVYDFHNIQDQLKTILEADKVLKHVHLKDIERYLIKIIDIHQVKKQTKSFMGFNNGEVLIGDKEKNGTASNLASLAADIVFDCSGSARIVIEEVNNSHSTQPPFNKEPIEDVPIKKHFLAYVKMSDEDFAKLNQGKQLKNENLTQQQLHDRLLALEKLQKLGWKHHAPPTFNLFDFGKTKRIFYCEMPDDFPKEHYDDWLLAVFEFYTGSNSISFTHPKPSETYEKKPRYQAFEVNPHRLCEFSFAGDEVTPIIIPLGDTQLEPDYRLGIGLKYGVDRTNILLEHMRFANGAIADIDFESYANTVAKKIDEQQQAIKDYYIARARTLRNASSELFAQYERAIETAKNEESKQHFTQSAQKLRESVFKQASVEAMDMYRSFCKASQDIDLTSIELSDLLTINSAMIRAINLAQGLDTNKSADELRECLISLARGTVKYAENIYAENPFMSEMYYTEALEVYNKAFPGQYLDQVADLYLGWIEKIRESDIDSALEKTDNACALLESQCKADDTLLSKLLLQRASLIFEAVNKTSSHLMFGAGAVQQYTNRLPTLFESMAINPHISSTEYQSLCDQYRATIQKYQLGQIEIPARGSDLDQKSNLAC